MNEITEPSFPQTRKDLSNLKSTAIDAAKDISGTATVHAKKAQGHLQDLATHVQDESSEQLEQVKVGLYDIVDKFRAYFALRPLACMGTALAIGFLLGASRRSR